MEPGLDRPDGESQGIGRVHQGQADVVVEHDERPLVRRQMQERPVQLVAIRDRADVVRRGSCSRQSTCACPVTARLAIARVDEQAAKPDLEAVGVTSAPMPARHHQGILDGIVRSLLVMEDQPGDDIEPVDREACQVRERLVIVCHRPLDQVPLHRASR